MSLRKELLAPISETQPSGQNIRYAPVYDKVKEARRKEDPIAQRDWQRPLKEADYRLVKRLTTEVLTRTSKDLQIAAWLTEALVHQEGMKGLMDGLDLLRGLLETFWDTLYPEAEDGDFELRAAPLSWVGEYRDLENSVRNVPLTSNGLGWLTYNESRTVGYEADVGDSDAKRRARKQAIAEGKLTAEDFAAAVAATPVTYLNQVRQDAGGALESLNLLDEACQQKFGGDAPGFALLRSAIEDVQHTARMLWIAQGGKESDPEEVEPEPPPQYQAEDVAEVRETAAVAEELPTVATTAGAAAATQRAPENPRLSLEPVDRDDAVRRIVSAAVYLRSENPYSPVPYLLLRSLRWGELRAAGDLKPELLEAPSSEIRQKLKRSVLSEQWDQVIETAEEAMALPCGRAWLDLQRHVIRACDERGSSCARIASAIRSELRALILDFPDLPKMTLLDDTPTANNETLAWLTELIPPPAPPPEPVPEPEPAPEVEELEPIVAMTPAATVDAYDLALKAARSGNAEEALQTLAQQIGHERSGRGRFLRRMQLAQICMASNRHAIAYPILQDLAQEIDKRKLEGWEQPDAIAQTLALLMQCMQKLRIGEEDIRNIYAQICRLDPIQAARLTD